MKKRYCIVLSLFAAVLLLLGAIAVIGGGFGPKPNRPAIHPGSEMALLFAHRGVRNRLPENSAGGIQEARRLGFTALEIDIRESGDRRLIVFHDITGRRLLGIDEKIRNLTVEQLKAQPLLHRGRVTPNYLLTLEELFRRFGDDFIIYLDMKVLNSRIMGRLVKLIRQYRLQHSVLVANINFFKLAYLEFTHPDIMTVLEGFYTPNHWLYRFIPRKFKPDFLSGFADRVDSEHIRWLRENRLLNRQIVYGVDQSNFRQVIDLGIRKIIIDYDSAMVDLLENNKESFN